MADELTKKQVRRAGELLRKRYAADTLDFRDPKVFAAFNVAQEFRAQHIDAMSAVAVDLQEAFGGGSTRVGQRLKRISRMIQKLAIHRTALDRLADIGGCRVVLPDSQIVVASAAEIIAHMGVERINNYIKHPRPSGYRAIHLIHERDGRLIEIQLRSPAQHHWAEVVEKAEEITGFALKDSQGPDELLEYFQVAASKLAIEESGETPDNELVERLAALRERIRPYYRQPGRSS